MDQTAYFEQMRQRRRTEILSCARDIILRDGPVSLTMQKLARTLDISNVTLYKYFKNINDIFYTLAQNAVAPCGQWFRPSQDSEEPLKRFLQNYQFLCEELLEHREDLSLLVILYMYNRQQHLPPEEQPAAAEIKTFEQTQRRLLDAADSRGLLAPGVVPEDALSFVQTVVFSFLEHIALLDREEYDSRREQISRQILQLIRMFETYLSKNDAFSRL